MNETFPIFYNAGPELTLGTKGQKASLSLNGSSITLSGPTESLTLSWPTVLLHHFSSPAQGRHRYQNRYGQRIPFPCCEATGHRAVRDYKLRQYHAFVRETVSSICWTIHDLRDQAAVLACKEAVGALVLCFSYRAGSGSNQIDRQPVRCSMFP